MTGFASTRGKARFRSAHTETAARRLRACALACIGLAVLAPAQLQASEAVSPPPGARPLRVTIGFYLLNLVSVDERSETFDADLYLDCNWLDPRLAFENDDGSDAPRIYQGEGALDHLQEIWWPDLEFVNTASPDITNRTLFVHPDGSVRYSLGLSSTFRARLDLRRFPFDEQVLEVRLQSFEADRSLLVLEPAKGMIGFDAEDDYAGLAIAGVDAFERTSHVSGWEQDFSELWFEIHVARAPAFYVWTIFVPLTMVVLLSCTIFFVPIEGFHDRIGIALACFLACIATQFAMSFNLPKISYLTPIDRLFLVAYGCMSVGVAISVVETALLRDAPGALRRTDRLASVFLPVLYAALVFFVVLP